MSATFLGVCMALEFLAFVSLLVVGLRRAERVARAARAVVEHWERSYGECSRPGLEHDAPCRHCETDLLVQMLRREIDAEDVLATTPKSERCGR